MLNPTLVSNINPTLVTLHPASTIGSTALPVDPHPTDTGQSAAKGGSTTAQPLHKARKRKVCDSHSGIAPGTAAVVKQALGDGHWCWALSLLDSECNIFWAIEQELMREKIKFWREIGSGMILRRTTYRDPAALPVAA
jgi:hypothetical protein